MEMSYRESSDDEFERQELEAALYSHIHFGSGLTPASGETAPVYSSLFRHSVVTQPIRAGLHEFRSTKIASKVKQPAGLGSFIAFSNDENPSCVLPISKQEERSESVVALDTVGDKEESFEDNDLLLQHVLEVENDMCRQEQESLLKHATSVAKEEECITVEGVEDINAGHSIGKKSKQVSETVKVKSSKNVETGVLLPFQVTNAPLKKIKRKPEVVVVEDTDAVIELKESPKKTKGSKRKNDKLSKLEDFLVLNGSSSPSKRVKKNDNFVLVSKQKSLTKGEAAVKQRKPQVQVRRPPRPPAVLVKYRQDSDTSTDYSESDSLPTPSKKRRNVDDIQSQDKIKQKETSKRESQSGHGSSSSESENEENLGKELCAAVVSEPVCVSSEGESTSDENEETGDIGDQRQEGGVAENENTDDEEIIANDDSDGDESDDEEDDSDDNTDGNGESSDGSESSVGDLLDSGPIPALPGLDFNLAGGVSTLLSTEKEAETSEDLWKIEDKDRYNIQGPMSRYFAPRTIQCRNCKKDGHLSRDCPEPLKQRCVYCGEADHNYKLCPQAICFNCSGPGHKTNDCPNPKMDWYAKCDRCWMTGHLEKMCPDRWRQFDLSLTPVMLRLGENRKGQAVIPSKNPLVFCYNCGKKGHRGYECRQQRMNRFVAASYPFVAKYDGQVLKASSIPLGMTLEETVADYILEKKLTHLERRMKESGHTKKITILTKWTDQVKTMREELESGRQNIAKRIAEENRKRKDKSSDKERTADDESSGRNRSKGVKRHNEQTTANSSLRYRDRYSDISSKSRSDQRQEAKRQRMDNTSKSKEHKNNKRKYKDNFVDEDESVSSFEDMASHQVGNNEWWLAQREASPPKKKRGKKKKKVPPPQSDSYDYEKDYEFSDHDEGSRDFPDFSLRQPETTFVYVNRQQPSIPTEYAQAELRTEHQRYRSRYDEYESSSAHRYNSRSTSQNQYHHEKERSFIRKDDRRFWHDEDDGASHSDDLEDDEILYGRLKRRSNEFTTFNPRKGFPNRGDHRALPSKNAREMGLPLGDHRKQTDRFKSRSHHDSYDKDFNQRNRRQDKSPNANWHRGPDKSNSSDSYTRQEIDNRLSYVQG